jgi:hypothetical protein
MPHRVRDTRKFNISSFDKYSYYRTFIPIPSLLKGRCLGRLVARGGSGACGRGGDVPLRTRGALGSRPGPLRGSAFSGWTGQAKGGRKPVWMASFGLRLCRKLRPQGRRNRRDGTSRGVAVCLYFPAIRETSRGRYTTRCAFRRSASLSSDRERGPPNSPFTRRILRAAMTLGPRKEQGMRANSLSTSSPRRRGPIPSVLVMRKC